MPNKLTGVSIDGIEEVQHILANWPQEARDEAGKAGAEYLINKFQAQPPPNYITRKQAYGQTFFSVKQRKWFFANLREGKIRVPYKRTQKTRKGWQKIGRGEDIIIVNETDGAYYTMDDQGQTRHEKLIGWQKVSSIIADSIEKLEARMSAAGEKALKKLGAK